MDTLIYRVEHPNGDGAFNASSWGDMDRFDARIPDYMDSRPMPYDDGIELPPWGEVKVKFGCLTVEQLQHWFPACVADLLEANGLEFTVWEVPPEDVVQGYTQAVFKPDRARCVERQPVANLHRQLALAA